MRKYLKLLCLIITCSLISFSCNNSGQTGDNDINKIKSNLKISIDASSKLSKIVSINEYAVTDLNITIKNENETEIITEAKWNSSESNNVIEFELPVNNNYKLYVDHKYVDNSENNKILSEGPFDFKIKKGIVTEIIIIPGGITTIIDTEQNNTTYSLSGTVTLNENGVAGVNIVLENTSYSATTSSDGTFIINDVESGEYKILTEKEDYSIFLNSYNRKITVNSNLSNIDMTALPITKTGIHLIQGDSHSSAMKNQSVNNVIGIVTAISGKGFFLQDVDPDNKTSTSEGIYIYQGKTPTVSKGDLVAVDGTVKEYIPGGTSTGNLSITQITSPIITTYAYNYQLPEPVILGKNGRKIPNEIICDDAINNVLSSTFDPENDGIDFYESIEGMLVKINNPLVVGPKNKYGEISVVADNGENANISTIRNGIILRENDYNPEIIRIDDYIVKNPFEVKIGDIFNDSIIGVINYSYGYFKVYNIEELPAYTSSSLEKEITNLVGDNDSVTIATYNVENLSAVSNIDKIEGAAFDIVNNLKSPDIIGLVEIQDNNGTKKGETDASLTYQSIINKINELGGPTYKFRDIAPLEDQDGGIPGGNIRCGFIYNSTRVSFVDRKGGNATSSTTVTNINGKAQLSYSPGRIDPENIAFENSRKSLIGEFIFNNEKIYVIVNHFKSKGGDTPQFGFNQPMILNSEEKRNMQAKTVADFVSEIIAIEENAKIVVLGDLNDFEFSAPLLKLENAGLYNLYYDLAVNERYSYNYQGNSQALDHIFISDYLKKNSLPEFDIVHICSEFPNTSRTSDHDPLITKITF